MIDNSDLNSLIYQTRILNVKNPREFHEDAMAHFGWCRKQSKKVSFYESAVQNILGLIIAFVVFQIAGISVLTSIKIQVTLFFLSFIRSFIVRRVFTNVKNS